LAYLFHARGQCLLSAGGECDSGSGLGDAAGEMLAEAAGCTGDQDVAAGEAEDIRHLKAPSRLPSAHFLFRG
jgi:hypothetical protein